MENKSFQQKKEKKKEITKIGELKNIFKSSEIYEKFLMKFKIFVHFK